jgi:RNA polymerase sigma-B factor
MTTQLADVVDRTHKASRHSGRVTAEQLLRQRAQLPAGHPDRGVLRSRGIEAGLPLARALAAKYRGRGEPDDDLYQVAALALIKAVDGYDPARNIAFSTYAVPTILGSLKRHFRDTSWRVRVPRNVQELAITLGPANARLAQQLCHSPSRRELAEYLGVGEQEVAAAAAAWHAHHPVSLDAAPTSNDQPPSIAAVAVIDTRFDAIDDRHTLRPLLEALSLRDRRILAMRYLDEMTQAQIAARIGVSQMQISRVLSRTLTKLRTEMLTPAPHTKQGLPTAV